MFHLLRGLDTRKWTHRTYVVSSGDAFSAQRAVEFEGELEARVRAVREEKENGEVNGQGNGPQGGKGRERGEKRPPCIGPSHYNIATVPRARRIHQSLLTTPFSSLYCLWRCFNPLLSSSPLLSNQSRQTLYEAAAQDLPDIIITNGPATAVIIILASLILRFFDIRGANSRGKCRTVYVESFARVKTLSLSGKLLLKVVDKFVVQWEELEGKGGGKAEFWGVLV